MPGVTAIQKAVILLEADAGLSATTTPGVVIMLAASASPEAVIMLGAQHDREPLSVHHAR